MNCYLYKCYPAGKINQHGGKYNCIETPVTKLKVKINYYLLRCINQFVPIEYIDSPVVACSYCIDEVNVLITTPIL